MNIGELITTLGVDTIQLDQADKKVAEFARRSQDKMTSVSRNVSREVTKQNSVVTSSFNKLGAAIIATASIGALVSFSKASMRAYDEQIKADTKLLQAMKGRESAMKRMAGLSTQLQNKTLFADEESTDAMARMASILGDNEEAIKRLLPLVQDFATVKGMALSSAAELITKTVASSTNSLSRYGIEVKGTAGSATRLNSVMEALNKNFAGQAEAIAKVGLGPMQQLKIQIGELQEAFGAWMVNSSVFQKVIKEWTTEIKMFGDQTLTFWQKVGMGIGSGQKYLDYLEKVKSLSAEIHEESGGGPLTPTPEIPKQIETLNTLNEQLKKEQEVLLDINILDRNKLEMQKNIITALQTQIEKISKIEEVSKKLEFPLEKWLNRQELTKSKDMDLGPLEQSIKDMEALAENIEMPKIKMDVIDTRDQVEQLTKGYMDQRDAVGLLSDSLMGFFTDAETGWKNMLDTFSQAINRFLAEQAAKALLKFVLSMIPGAAPVTTALNFLPTGGGGNGGGLGSVASAAKNSLDISGKLTLDGRDASYLIKRNA